MTRSMRALGLPSPMSLAVQALAHHAVQLEATDGKTVKIWFGDPNAN